jgi:hypothetical protein
MIKIPNSSDNVIVTCKLASLVNYDSVNKWKVKQKMNQMQKCSCIPKKSAATVKTSAAIHCNFNRSKLIIHKKQLM